MSTRLIRATAVACVTLLAATWAATPAFAGPPWISAEYPSNPHEASTRGAFFLVHTYHHGAPMSSVLAGTAEGIVNGRRQTMKLDIVETGKPGIYAVRYQPTAGVWVLAINMGSGDDAAGMLATVGKNGELSSVSVPSRTVENGRWVIPRAVTAQDVNAALQAQTALLGESRPSVGMTGLQGGALFAMGLGLILGVPAFRRNNNKK
jgi:hypothetical protein